MRDELSAEEEARRLLLKEHPEVREQYEMLRPAYQIAEEIIRARRAAGITQAQLAERVGKQQSVISQIESGRRSPRLETLASIAAALGLELRVELAQPVEAGTSDRAPA